MPKTEGQKRAEMTKHALAAAKPHAGRLSGNKAKFIDDETETLFAQIRNLAGWYNKRNHGGQANKANFAKIVPTIDIALREIARITALAEAYKKTYFSFTTAGVDQIFSASMLYQAFSRLPHEVRGYYCHQKGVEPDRVDLDNPLAIRTAVIAANKARKEAEERAAHEAKEKAEQERIEAEAIAAAKEEQALRDAEARAAAEELARRERLHAAQHQTDAGPLIEELDGDDAADLPSTTVVPVVHEPGDDDEALVVATQHKPLATRSHTKSVSALDVAKTITWRALRSPVSVTTTLARLGWNGIRLDGEGLWRAWDESTAIGDAASAATLAATVYSAGTALGAIGTALGVEAAAVGTLEAGGVCAATGWGAPALMNGAAVSAGTCSVAEGLAMVPFGAKLAASAASSTAVASFTAGEVVAGAQMGVTTLSAAAYVANQQAKPPLPSSSDSRDVDFARHHHTVALEVEEFCPAPGPGAVDLAGGLAHDTGAAIEFGDTLTLGAPQQAQLPGSAPDTCPVPGPGTVVIGGDAPMVGGGAATDTIAPGGTGGTAVGPHAWQADCTLQFTFNGRQGGLHMRGDICRQLARDFMPPTAATEGAVVRAGQPAAIGEANTWYHGVLTDDVTGQAAPVFVQRGMGGLRIIAPYAQPQPMPAAEGGLAIAGGQPQVFELNTDVFTGFTRHYTGGQLGAPAAAHPAINIDDHMPIEFNPALPQAGPLPAGNMAHQPAPLVVPPGFTAAAPPTFAAAVAQAQHAEQRALQIRLAADTHAAHEALHQPQLADTCPVPDPGAVDLAGGLAHDTGAAIELGDTLTLGAPQQAQLPGSAPDTCPVPGPGTVVIGGDAPMVAGNATAIDAPYQPLLGGGAATDTIAPSSTGGTAVGTGAWQPDYCAARLTYNDQPFTLHMRGDICRQLARDFMPPTAATEGAVVLAGQPTPAADTNIWYQATFVTEATGQAMPVWVQRGMHGLRITQGDLPPMPAPEAALALPGAQPQIFELNADLFTGLTMHYTGEQLGAPADVFHHIRFGGGHDTLALDTPGGEAALAPFQGAPQPVVAHGGFNGMAEVDITIDTDRTGAHHGGDTVVIVGDEGTTEAELIIHQPDDMPLVHPHPTGEAVAVAAPAVADSLQRIAEQAALRAQREADARAAALEHELAARALREQQAHEAKEAADAEAAAERDRLALQEQQAREAEEAAREAARVERERQAHETAEAETHALQARRDAADAQARAAEQQRALAELQADLAERALREAQAGGDEAEAVAEHDVVGEHEAEDMEAGDEAAAVDDVVAVDEAAADVVAEAPAEAGGLGWGHILGGGAALATTAALIGAKKFADRKHRERQEHEAAEREAARQRGEQKDSSGSTTADSDDSTSDRHEQPWLRSLKPGAKVPETLYAIAASSMFKNGRIADTYRPGQPIKLRILKKARPSNPQEGPAAIDEMDLEYHSEIKMLARETLDFDYKTTGDAVKDMNTIISVVLAKLAILLKEVKPPEKLEDYTIELELPEVYLRQLAPAIETEIQAKMPEAQKVKLAFFDHKTHKKIDTAKVDQWKTDKGKARHSKEALEQAGEERRKQMKQENQWDENTQNALRDICKSALFSKTVKQVDKNSYTKQSGGVIAELREETGQPATTGAPNGQPATPSRRA